MQWPLTWRERIPFKSRFFLDCENDPLQKYAFLIWEWRSFQIKMESFDWKGEGYEWQFSPKWML